MNWYRFYFFWFPSYYQYDPRVFDWHSWENIYSLVQYLEIKF